MAIQTPYCTAQDVIDLCSWPRFGTLSDSAQTRLIAAASGKVDKACRRPFGLAAQSIAETLDGRNLPTVWLSLRPVISVDAVTINGEALDNTFGDAWSFDAKTGKLVRGSGQDDERFAPWFPAGVQNVVVQYWGGYDTIPDEIVEATALYVRYLYERGRVTGLYSSESIGDWSGTLNAAALAGTVPDHIMALLADYEQDGAF